MDKAFQRIMQMPWNGSGKLLNKDMQMRKTISANAIEMGKAFHGTHPKQLSGSGKLSKMETKEQRKTSETSATAYNVHD